MKAEFPDLTIVLNGGLETLAQAQEHIGGLDGLMFGRAAYHTPWMLSEVDHTIFGDVKNDITRDDIVMQLIDYAKSVEQKLPSSKALIRHIMGLYHGQIGARIWRRALSEADRALMPSQKILQAYEAVLCAREQAA